VRPSALTIGTCAVALALTGCASNASETEATVTATDTVDEVVAATDAATATEVATPSADDVATLEAVTVNSTAGSPPSLEFTQPFSVSAPVSRLVSEGTGAALEPGQQIVLKSLVYSGDGSVLYSDWDLDAVQTATYGGADELSELLSGAKVGAQVLAAFPGDPAQGLPETVLMYYEVVDAKTILPRAEGEAVTPEPGLPVVTLAADGAPSIAVPADYQAPTDLVVQTLIRGTGPEVTENQTVTVHYTGWLLDGTEFDSSWSRGEPTSFPLNQVIPGWTQGLTGQTVGSQVLLIIPPDLAYGDQETGTIPANSTLVFVVDILAAS